MNRNSKCSDNGGSGPAVSFADDGSDIRPVSHWELVEGRI